MKDLSLLVIGARQGSLGYRVAQQAKATSLWDLVETAGVSGEEDHHLNVMEVKFDNFWERWTDVVCTVGINVETRPGEDQFATDVAEQLRINAAGPLACLNDWYRVKRDAMGSPSLNSWVMVSSNSAHIARTNSVGYCASKAALSMGVRSFARTISQEESPCFLWGFEPGWMDGTPMSREVIQRMPSGVPPHRIPGHGVGMNASDVAELIVESIRRPDVWHGTMTRLDGGDQ